MTVSAPETDVAGLGKPVNDIQSSFSVSGKTMSVTPVKITDNEDDPDWVTIWGSEEAAKGYFVVFDAGVDGASTVTVTMLRAAGSTVPSHPATIDKAKDTFAFYLGPTTTEAKKANGIKIEGIVNGVKKTENYTLEVNLD